MRRVLLALLAVTAACSSNSKTGTTALFSLSAGSGSAAGGAPDGSDNDFYALPYPNDIRRTTAGTIDLTLFPTNSLVVDSYRVAAQALDGFGLNSVMFARFDDAIDPATLPTVAASVVPGSSVYLVNIDATSPDYNTRTPITTSFVAAAGETIGGNRLAVRPYPGFSLDEGTTYALVVTTRIHDLAGGPIQADTDFVTALTGSGPTQTAYAPFLTWLGKDADDKPGDIASAAVFTTQHATFIADALRTAIFATPAPVGANVIAASGGEGYDIFTGTYTAPNFQQGTVPYLSTGGEILVGSDGAAVIDRMEPMRFALTIPPGPVPATGFPFAVYAHGSDGDYMSFIQDGTAGRLAAVGIAVISTDQVLSGPLRNPGGDDDIDFFNFGNPYAARDNALQGAADAWSQMRLAEGLSVVDGTRTVTFDPGRVMFFGHSQGGLTGPAFVAFEPTLKGAVLSGTGGVLYLAMLLKTQPLNIPDLVGTFLRDNPIDADNASIGLAQMWLERADGVNYAGHMVRNPPHGEAAREHLPERRLRRHLRAEPVDRGVRDLARRRHRRHARYRAGRGPHAARQHVAADAGDEQQERRDRGARAVQDAAGLRRSLRRVRGPGRRGAVGAVPRHARRDRRGDGRDAAVGSRERGAQKAGRDADRGGRARREQPARRARGAAALGRHARQDVDRDEAARGAGSDPHLEQAARARVDRSRSGARAAGGARARARRARAAMGAESPVREAGAVPRRRDDRSDEPRHRRRAPAFARSSMSGRT